MKSIFSRFILAPAVLAAAALVTTSATAESVAKVPFNFSVGSKTLPAGDYAIRHDDTNHFVTLLRKGSSDIYTWILGPGEPNLGDSTIALNFDKVGDAHVLQSIQYGSQVTGRLDKKSARQAEHESIRLSGGR